MMQFFLYTYKQKRTREGVLMRLKIMMGIECLLTVACIPFLVVSETLIGSAVYVSIGLIVLAKLALVYMRHKNMKMTYKKSEIIATTILSVLFVIMISIFDILGSGFLHIDSLINVYSSTVAHTIQVWAYMIYIPAVCVSAFVLVRYMIHAALENRIGGGGYSKKDYRCCLGIISSLSVVYLFSTYPGIWVRDDVTALWGHVCEREWDAWQTLGYELFVVLCSFFGKSTFAVNVVQTILWIFLNAYILDVLHEESTKNMKIYTAVLIFVAVPFNYLEVMYKDVVFSMGILAITVGIYHIVKKQNVIWQDILTLTIGGAFVSLCRHGGNVVVLMSFVSLAVYFFMKRRKKDCQYLVGITVFQVCLFLLVNVGFMHVLNAAKNPAYIKYTMPMVTISGAVSYGAAFEAEDIEVLEKIMPVEEWGGLL